MTPDKQNMVRILKPQQKKISSRWLDFGIGCIAGLLLSCLIFFIYSLFNHRSPLENSSLVDHPAIKHPQTHALSLDQTLHQMPSTPHNTTHLDNPSTSTQNKSNPNPENANDLSLLFQHPEPAQKSTISPKPPVTQQRIGKIPKSATEQKSAKPTSPSADQATTQNRAKTTDAKHSNTEIHPAPDTPPILPATTSISVTLSRTPQ